MADAAPIDSPRHRAGDAAAASRAPEALPAPPMPFLGREDDLARVLALLDEPNVRLLTLTGPGGVGKTRLALEVARQVEDDFADGARYVSLAQITDASSVLPAVAREMQVRGLMRSNPLDDLILALRDRHILLVLDNFEHLLDESPVWLSTLIGIAPKVKVLVTSRVPLHIDGEHCFIVSPFDVPGVDAPTELRSSTAVALFAQRARAVDTAFVLDDTNVPAVAEICRQLDGLALAVELAAARITVLSPDQILARLSDRLALLSSGPRDAPDRHRSIRDAIGWSYDLLTVEARSAFRRIAVFVGGASIDAIAFGLSPDVGGAGGDAISVVSELVDHNLIRAMPGTGAEPRYAMLQTIRELGLGQLVALGEEQSAREAHAAWFMKLGEAATVGLDGTEMGPWLDRLEPDHENLRGAITWLRSQDQIEHAIKLAFDTILFFHIRGYQAGTDRLFAEFLSHPRIAAPTMYRVRALLVEGLYGQLRGEHAWARAAAEEALALTRSLNVGWAEGWALGIIGQNAMAQGDLDAAISAHETRLAVSEPLREYRSMAIALTNLGNCAMHQGRIVDAERYQDAAVRVGQDHAQPWVEGLAKVYLGEIALHRQDYPRAARLLEEGKRTLADLGSTLDVPKTQLLLARLALERDDNPAAETYLYEGLKAAQTIGEKESIARLSLELGRNALARNKWPEAATRFVASITQFLEIRQPAGAADCLEALAALAVASGDSRLADRMIEAVDRLRAMPGTRKPPEAENETAAVTLTRARREAGSGDRADLHDADATLDLDGLTAEVTDLERRIAEKARTARSREVEEQSGLTPRELEVLRYLADGLGNQEIADAMFVSRRTVASHVEHILTRLDLRSRTAAVAYAIRNGLV